MANAPDTEREEHYDVAIIGAGVAGVAASILLRRAGRRVICLDTRPYPHHQVGESLDWSSPALLRRLGVPIETLIADRIATYKKNIALCELDRPEWRAAPPRRLRRSPLRFETVTIHADRAALDQRLYEQAVRLGATFAWERVVRIDTDGERIAGCATSANRRVVARWYVDASGTARHLARALRIPWTAYGRKKACLWTSFDTPPLGEGTTFFLDNRAAYLSWVWDIPISPERTSVGWVLPYEALQQLRSGLANNQAVLLAELSRHRRFDRLLATERELRVERVSFQPFVTARVCGPNWFIAGEAAAMPDPLTGNGVTSAIRHARYVTQAIVAAGANPAIAAAGRRTYRRHVHRLGQAFNTHIEQAIYQAPIRQAFGLPRATMVYTGFAFFMNALYARFDPRGPIGMAAFDLLFVAARLWVSGWALAARITLRLGRPAADGASAGSRNEAR